MDKTACYCGESPRRKVIRIVWLGALAAFVVLMPSRPLAGQLADHNGRRAASTTEAFAGNLLIGGVTAATRALISGKDPFRAFTLGALGGTVHFAGKLIAGEPGTGSRWTGWVVGATGSSIVSNAGRGVGPLEELTLPVASLRLRVTPRAPDKLRVSVNAYETFVVARNLTRGGMAIDWGLSASSGAFVFLTENRNIRSNGQYTLGVVPGGPVIVLNGNARDRERIMRHEFAHVQQIWFAQDAVGNPLEGYARRRIAPLRWIPKWLDVGLAAPALVNAEFHFTGSDGPVRRVMEAEAELIERQ